MATPEIQTIKYDQSPQLKGVLDFLFGSKTPSRHTTDDTTDYGVIKRFDLRGSRLAPCPVEIQRLPVGAYIDAVDLFGVPSSHLRIIANRDHSRRSELWRYLVLNGPHEGANGSCTVVEHIPKNMWILAQMSIKEAFGDYLGFNSLSQEEGIVARVPKGGCELVEVGAPGEQDGLIPSATPTPVEQLGQPVAKDANRYWDLLSKLSKSPQSPPAVQAHLRAA